MSRTGLYDCHIFWIFVDDFISNINCGIGVLHVKRQNIDVFFCDVIYLFAQVFIVSVDRAYSRIELALRFPEPGKNWNINETF